MSQHVIPVSEVDFDTEVLEADVPVLVDVSTPWCAPCRALKPLLEQLASERTGVKVVEIDAEASPALARQLGVRGFPTILAFRQGQEVGRHLGLTTLARLRTLAERELVPAQIFRPSPSQ